MLDARMREQRVKVLWWQFAEEGMTLKQPALLDRGRRQHPDFPRK